MDSNHKYLSQPYLCPHFLKDEKSESYDFFRDFLSFPKIKIFFCNSTNIDIYEHRYLGIQNKGGNASLELS